MLPLDQEWTALALCTEVGGDIWFPDKGEPSRAAKAVCNKCPVKRECLDYALAYESGEMDTQTSYASGIFGGLSEHERRVLRKERQALTATGTDDTPAAVVEDRPTPKQYGLPYVGGANGDTHYPIPKATDGYRKAHAPQTKPKPGIDWDALRREHEERRRAEGALEQETPCPPTASTAPSTSATPAPRSTTSTTTADAAAADAKANPTTKTTTGTTTTPTTATPDTSAPSTTKTASPSASTATDAPDVVDYCHQLLRDTTRDPRPLVQVLRSNALSALAALDLVANPIDDTTPLTPVVASAPAPAGLPVRGDGDAATGQTKRKPPARRNGPERLQLPADTVNRYLAGATTGQLAADLGVSIPTVRRWLLEHGVQLRAARINYTPELIEAVRTRYIDHHMTQGEIANDLDVSTKVVQTAMNLAGIDRREAKARVAADNARGLKNRLTDLGVTSHQVKTWALEQSLIDHITTGLPKTTLVDAYTAAHNQQGATTR